MWTSFVLLSGLAGVLCAPAYPSFRAASLDDTIADLFRQGDTNHDGIRSRAETWAEFLAMDRNGDKKVSLEEYSAKVKELAPSMAAKAPQFFAKEDIDQDGFIDEHDVNKIYTAMDTDGNGEVSMSEFTVSAKQFFSEFGFGPTEPTPTSSSNVTLVFSFSAAFKSVDTNGDGYLTLEEQWTETLRLDKDGDKKVSLAEYLVPFGSSPAFGATIFKKADINEDGYLDEYEIRQGRIFIDTNGDGNITQSEFVATLKQIYAEIAITLLPSITNITAALDGVFKTVDQNVDGYITFEEQWPVTLLLDKDGDKRVSLAEYLVQFQNGSLSYGQAIFKKFDFNHNGYFEESDLRQGMDVLDSDGDGLVSLDEFVDYFVQIYVQIAGTLSSSNNNVTLDVSLANAFKSADTNGNGHLTVEEQWAESLLLDEDGDKRVSLAEYLMPFGTSPAFGAAIFEKIDINQDGYFDEYEVRQGLRFLDTNGDGNVTQSEFVASLKQIYGQISVAVIPSITNITAALDGVFKTVDKNKDGYITFEEQWPVTLLLDIDGDKRVSLAEYLVQFQNGSLSYGQAIFKQVDFNHNGYIEESDLRKEMDFLDSDGDGLVSLDEFVDHLVQIYNQISGTVTSSNNNVTLEVSLANAFKSADTNGNGHLTVEEQWAESLLLDDDGDRRVSLAEYLMPFGSSPAFGAAIFEKIDINQDGYFDEHEVRQGLAFLDTDGDGNVTQSEFVASLKQIYGQISVAVIPSITNITAALDGVFKTVDKNKDGYITFEEQWPVTLLLDIDGDKRVSLAEYLVQFQNDSLSYGQAIFKQLDFSHNGYIEESDLRQGMDFLDTDGDGLVSLDEFVDHFVQIYSQLGMVLPGTSVSPTTS